MTNDCTAMSTVTQDEIANTILSHGFSAAEDCLSIPESGNQTWLSRQCSRLVLKTLGRMNQGRLALRFGCNEAAFGDPDCETPAAILNVHSSNFFKRLLVHGAMGAAESYMDNEWSTPDLTGLFRVLLQNEDTLNTMRSRRFSIAEAIRKIEHFRNRNSTVGSKKNIHEHYDLGNHFFSLFLDESMMYSSAIFPSDDSTLVDASWEKVDRVCRRLQLTADDNVIEIGTGWGGFALHAAKHYGCKITTATISNEQYTFAKNRIQKAGLSERVTVLLNDYRELNGRFDKLVSLEMIEAVGRDYLPGYFETCQRLVKDDGAMMLQAIVMPEQKFDRFASSVDFIQKYVFPGGFLPSITEMQNCIKQNTSFRMAELKDFGMHYALTLNHWNQRFHNRLDEVREQGFSERFIRMWRYYLCYCEAAFLERATGLVQTLWVKPGSKIGQLG